MAAIWTSKQSWLQRPTGPIRVDYSSPLASGLVACHPLTAHNQVNITKNGSPTYSEVNNITRDPALVVDGYFNTQYVYLTHNLGTTDIPAVTLLGWNNRRLNQVASMMILDPLALYGRTGVRNGLAQKTYAYCDTSSSIFLSSTTGLTDPIGTPTSMPERAGMVFNGSLASASRLSPVFNGTLPAKTDVNTPGAVVKLTASHVLSIGMAHNGNTTTPLYGYAAYHDVFVWNRALSVDELAYDYNPRTRWNIYARVPLRTYFDLGSAAPSYTPLFYRRR